MNEDLGVDQRSPRRGAEAPLTLGGLDHVVHAVGDLDRAAQRYVDLGFRVGDRNRHPWGTHNRIVQLPGFFIELLAVEYPTVVLPNSTPGLSFATFTGEFLRRSEGFAMLALATPDAAKAAEAFRQAGIAGFAPFRFERLGRTADGEPVRLGFSLAFAHDQGAPRCGFFACQQLNPHHFWDSAFQLHPNGVCAVSGVVIVAEDPRRHRPFLACFTGGRELDCKDNGLAITTERGRIEVLDAPGWRWRYGIEPPDLSAGPRLAAVRFLVHDLELARAVLNAGKVASTTRTGALMVAADDAGDATLVLEAETAR